MVFQPVISSLLQSVTGANGIGVKEVLCEQNFDKVKRSNHGVWLGGNHLFLPFSITFLPTADGFTLYSSKSLIFLSVIPI